MTGFGSKEVCADFGKVSVELRSSNHKFFETVIHLPPGYLVLEDRIKKFLEAKAEIDGDTILVYSNNISVPVAVRYAWSNNPEGANLYNKEGLPASPFRTSEIY